MSKEESLVNGYVPQHHLKRPAFEYCTIRGDESSSIMIAVRKDHVEEFECVEWRKTLDGHWKNKNRQGSPKCAFTRMMVCRIRINGYVGYPGHTHFVMNVHLNELTTAGFFGYRRLAYQFDVMSALITAHSVTVLMGDFGRACLVVKRELRQRGHEIDLAAWFPWKSLDGDPMMDSTAIFFVGMPGKHELLYDAGVLHARSESGFGSKAEDLRALKEPGKVGKWHGNWYRNCERRGPGFHIGHYLGAPKSKITLSMEEREKKRKGEKSVFEERYSASHEAMLSDMLQPSQSSQFAVAAHNLCRKSTNLLVTCEKRMAFILWSVDIDGHPTGSHYPLCVEMKNPSRCAACDDLCWERKHGLQRLNTSTGCDTPASQRSLDFSVSEWVWGTPASQGSLDISESQWILL